MPGPPFDEYAHQHTPVILNINGSPFHRGKADERIEIRGTRARDRLVDRLRERGRRPGRAGVRRRSVVVRPDGSLAHHAAMFEEDLLIVDIDGEISSAQDARRGRRIWSRSTSVWCSGFGTTYARTGSSRSCSACRAGSTRRSSRSSPGRARPRGRPHARDAVPVLVAREPRRREAGGQRARRPARRPRDRDVFSGLDALRETFRGTKEGVAEENLSGADPRQPADGGLEQVRLARARDRQQERVRGRYATLYGDMAGGFAPIKDVPKTVVYELAKWRNAIGGAETPPIPQRVLDKPPSAELRPDQKDTDSLRRTTSSTRSSRRTSRTTDRPRTSSPPVVWIRSSWTESSR